VDPAGNVHALVDYKKTISRMLKARRFEQLDCLADSARAHKEMFPGGMWKLRVIYSGIEEPLLHPTQQDWTDHMRLLHRWVSLKPRSITARVALAASYVNYAWDARGNGEHQTVSENGWKLFNERTDLAMQTLKDASILPDKCPQSDVVMQNVAMAQGWDPDAKQALLEQAIKLEPDYYYNYRVYANSILPKWGGNEGQAEEFLRQAADRVGGDAGNILYFQVTSKLLCGCDDDHKLKLSWPRIQKGFAALEKQSGAVPENWNLMARMAANFNDPVMTNKMLARIGDQWSEEVWQTATYFQSIKEWASEVANIMNTKSEQELAAEANFKTSDGRRYQALIDARFNAAMPDCLKVAESTDSDKFEILLKIGRDGTVDQIQTVGISKVGFCVMRAMGSQPHTRPTFPSPPAPGYWVRFDVDTPHSSSVALKK